ncbi:MAG: SDR family oxidoreductase [Oscillospiraceae bacterium]|jgi:3-oxoacyl-[acyl-carrier protein] reductase|nr:SDR family oxidoreductase [Oscillospiraceae bacterium]
MAIGNRFKDKVVIVTGSGQGVGRAVAIGFAEEGAKVVTNNRKPGSTRLVNMSEAQYAALSPEKKKAFDDVYAGITGDAESTAKTINDFGGTAIPAYGDIGSIADAEAIVKKAVEAFGTVDILINVAGAFGGGSLTDIPEDDWDRVTNIKPKGYFNMMKFAIPYMQKKGWGRVINATSKAFMGDIIKMAHYCAANAGAVGLTQGAACEFFHEGITVNAFGPWARTRAAYEGDYASDTGKGIPGQREFPKSDITPDPEAVVPFLKYLCTDSAKDVTGTVFTLAGNSVGVHQFPIISRNITKAGRDYWTVEELEMQAPRTLFQGFGNVLDFV